MLTLGNLASSNVVLGSLADQNTVSYTNEVTDKPTIPSGNLANANAVNLGVNDDAGNTGIDITSSAGNNVTMDVNNNLFSLNANATNRAISLSFNGNTPGSGNLRNSNVTLGNLASSNTVLGNFATLNDLNDINGNAANATNVNVDATVADESLYLTGVDGQTNAERICN